MNSGEYPADQETLMVGRSYYGTILRPPTRLNQITSLNLPILTTAMVANACAAITADGQIAPVKYENNTILLGNRRIGAFRRTTDPQLEIANPNELVSIDITNSQNTPAWWIASASPWGHEDIMCMLMPQEINTFHDIPDQVSQVIYRKAGDLLTQFQSDGLFPFWGINISPLGLTGKGFQSVLRIHAKACGIRNNITPQNIYHYRDSYPFDNGASRVLGEEITSRFISKTHHKVSADNLGFRIEIDNCSPKKFGDWEQTKKLWLGITDEISALQEELYAECYGQESTREANEMLQNARRNNGIIDAERYQRLFTWQRPQRRHSLYNKLQEIDDRRMLRVPFGGYAITVIFDRLNEKCTYLFTFSPEDKNIGPVEGMGIKLIRPDQPDPYTTVKPRYKRITEILAA